MELDTLEDLVIVAQQGGDEAFGRLVEGLQDVAYFTALRYLGDPAAAQDAAQEAFLDAYRSLPSLREPRAFPAWFRRIIFKHCDRQARRRQPLPLEVLGERPADLLGPEATLTQVARQEAIRAAVQALPPIYHQVVTLFYLQGHSYAEIAEELDLPLSTIKKRLHTGRQLLKEKMSPMTTTTYRPSEDESFANRVKFYIALKNDDLMSVRQLLRRTPELLESRTEWGVASDGWYWPLGVSPLHWAAGAGNLPLVELLVEAGADINVRDQTGATPLKRAAHMGQTEVARWLLEHGADPNLAASNGQAPLHVAIIRGRKETANLLLDHGADPTTKDSGGRTPGDWAAMKGWADLAQRLGTEQTLAPSPQRRGPLGPIWETGIKVIDLMAPLRWGGRNGIFTPRSGIGIDVLLGELVHRLALYSSGRTLQLGLERGDFTAESRRLWWRNCGVETHVEVRFGGEVDSAARQRHLAEQGVQRALELASSGPVLLMVYTWLALAEGVMPILERAGENEVVTLLLVGAESLGAEPPPLQNLDAALTFDALRAQQGLWPAVDPIRSYAQSYTSDEHRHTAEEARRLFKRYLDLHPIYEHQGMSGFDLPYFGDAERHAVVRARRLHRFLAQPMAVPEPWSATPSEYVPLADTLATTRAILNGELDEVAEEELAMIGRWSPKWT